MEGLERVLGSQGFAAILGAIPGGAAWLHLRRTSKSASISATADITSAVSEFLAEMRAELVSVREQLAEEKATNGELRERLELMGREIFELQRVFEGRRPHRRAGSPDKPGGMRRTDPPSGPTTEQGT